ncbi:hypothetical protein [Paenibacillus aquistagni]|uniref:hypothetical protein n=1 Tax=Paenibacillus aquistagni TaxID=1852522 RepID=UPI000A1CBCDB|nr:hypothetical protein [Paenibacillus aquistagni]
MSKLILNTECQLYEMKGQAVYSSRQVAEEFGKRHDREPKHYHFSNEADMINRIVLGMSAKQFRKVHNLEKNESIRPYLTNEQIKAVEALQRADIGLLISIPDYQDRKSKLAAYFERMKLKYIA